MPESIELKFYDDENEVESTYSVARVKTKFLKAAIRLKNEIGDPKDMDEKQIDILFDFIVDLFGARFTRAELEDKTDLFECFSVLGMVFGRANGLARQFTSANPTQAPSPKKK